MNHLFFFELYSQILLESDCIHVICIIIQITRIHLNDILNDASKRISKRYSDKTMGNETNTPCN